MQHLDPAAEPTTTTINQEAPVQCTHFKYLGNTVSNNASLDSELRNRARNASATFVKLHDGNDNGEVM